MKFLKKKKYIKIKLKKIISTHLQVKVKINGVKGKFIVDTGASNSCVGLNLKEYFKLSWEESPVKAAGAGAVDLETQLSENNQLKIGKWKISKCKIILIDLIHINSALLQQNAKEVHGIIGADILELGKAFIDYNKKNLYLKKVNKKKLKN
ncbi:MAG: retropepsin-like aspartic protease [Tenacibaculum sp.]